MIEFYGAWMGANFHTGAAVPTFLRLENYRGLSFFRIWNKNIHLAYINAPITAVENFRIKDDWIGGRAPIGCCIYFLVCHHFLSELINSDAFHSFLQASPRSQSEALR